MSINRVLISGNLTRDPEVRVTQTGTQILSIGVAVNDRRYNKLTGVWEDHPNFVDCVMFGSRAESVSRFLSKGSKVAIEGKLRYSSWETDGGDKRSKLEVVIDEIEFLSRSQTQAPQAPGAPYPPIGNQPAPQGYTPRQAPQMPQQTPQQVPQQTPQMPQQAPVQQPPLATAPQATPAVVSAPQAQAAPIDLYQEDIPF